MWKYEGTECWRVVAIVEEWKRRDLEVCVSV